MVALCIINNHAAYSTCRNIIRFYFVLFSARSSMIKPELKHRKQGKLKIKEYQRE